MNFLTLCFSSNLSNAQLTALTSSISYPFPTVLDQEVSSYITILPAPCNKQRQFYFARICRLWYALPLINVTLSMQTIKNKIKSHFWDHFTCFFDPLDPYKLHYLCLCSQRVSRQFLSTIQNLDSNSHVLFMWFFFSFYTFIVNFQAVGWRLQTLSTRASNNYLHMHEYCSIVHVQVYVL